MFALGQTPYVGIENQAIPQYISIGNRLDQPILCKDEMLVHISVFTSSRLPCFSMHCACVLHELNWCLLLHDDDRFSLIYECWQTDPEDRPCFSSIVNAMLPIYASLVGNELVDDKVQKDFTDRPYFVIDRTPMDT